MEMEVELAPFVAYKDCVSLFWVCTSDKFVQSGQKSLFRVIFDEKG